MLKKGQDLESMRNIYLCEVDLEHLPTRSWYLIRRTYFGKRTRRSCLSTFLSGTGEFVFLDLMFTRI